MWSQCARDGSCVNIAEVAGVGQEKLTDIDIDGPSSYAGLHFPSLPNKA